MRSNCTQWPSLIFFLTISTLVSRHTDEQATRHPKALPMQSKCNYWGHSPQNRCHLWCHQPHFHLIVVPLSKVQYKKNYSTLCSRLYIIKFINTSCPNCIILLSPLFFLFCLSNFSNSFPLIYSLSKLVQFLAFLMYLTCLSFPVLHINIWIWFPWKIQLAFSPLRNFSIILSVGVSKLVYCAWREWESCLNHACEWESCR